MKKLLLAAAFAMTAAPVAAQTVIDEDFESGTGGFTFSGDVAVVSGQAYVDNAFGVGTAAARANDFASFGSGNVAGTGLVFQGFTTVAGELYTLTFDFGAFNQSSQSLSYDLSGYGTTTLAAPPGSNNLDTLFSSYITTFIGNGSPTVLTFSSTSGAGDNADILLDNIRITGAIAGIVPEPATWALMILGFGAVGGAMRRRATVRTAIRFA